MFVTKIIKSPFLNIIQEFVRPYMLNSRLWYNFQINPFKQILLNILQIYVVTLCFFKVHYRFYALFLFTVL